MLRPQRIISNIQTSGTDVAAKTADETAMAFLNMAREYHNAANELFAISESRPRVHPDHRPLSSVLGNLYFHTLELGLKGFLRAHGLPIHLGVHRRGERCRQEFAPSGVGVGPAHRAPGAEIHVPEPVVRTRKIVSTRKISTHRHPGLMGSPGTELEFAL